MFNDGQVRGPKVSSKAEQFMGHLVSAVLRHYVAGRPDVSSEELRRAFPDEVRAWSPLQFSPVRVVVARLSVILQSKAKRICLAKGETLVVRDSDVTVSREWDLDSIQVFIARAKELRNRRRFLN